MRTLIKSVLERTAPSLLDLIRGLRIRWFFGRQFASLHALVRSAVYPNDEPIRVRFGPFEGLRYLDAIVWGPITPKWLGSYEAELSGIVDDIVRKRYTTIIDIGCAEGYYAVGLAYRVPHATIYAFDNDLISRRQIVRLAALNNVSSRIIVGRYCSHQSIDRLAGDNALIVCDIEGNERALLDPEQAPRLRRCDILVEVHENRDDAATERTLVQRFSPTHDIEVIDACDRTSWRAAHHLAMPASLIDQATNEHRNNGRRWLWMKARRTE